MQDINKKSDSKKVMGEIEVNRGTKAYNSTSGIYGLFAVVDKVQSSVTGVAMTDEVAQIRNGERLQAEAEKMLTLTR